MKNTNNKLLSFAILACNEHKELKELLDNLTSNMDLNLSEIIVVLDKGKTSQEVMSIVSDFEYRFPDNFFFEYHSLNNDFAEQKNYLNSLCNGKYIFQIDADENLYEKFITYLPQLLEKNEDVDLFNVPRINIVNGITNDHLFKWGWNMNELGWINHPDHQSRIYKNKPEIKWENKVHERIKGYETFTDLSPNIEMFHLIHIKDINRQEKQNGFYNSFKN